MKGLCTCAIMKNKAVPERSGPGNCYRTTSTMRKCILVVLVFSIGTNCEGQGLTNSTSTARFSAEEISTPQPKKIAASTDSEQPNMAFNSTTMPLKNVTVEAVYFAERNKIALNVSWAKPLDSDRLHSYLFKVSPSPKDTKCIDKSFETTVKNKTITHILLPPLINEHEIHPECTYRVSIAADYSELGRTTTELNYAVRECVGKKCSCTRLTPKCVEVSASEIVPGKLNVSWTVGCEYENDQVYNFTNVVLQYRPNETEHHGYNLFHPIPLFAHFDPKRNYIVLNEMYEHFRPDKMYEMQARFSNVYNCKTSSLTYFTVTLPKRTELIEEQPMESRWLQVTLGVTLATVLILAFIYLIRRNRLIIKEIIMDPFSLRLIRRGRRRSDLRNSYLMVPAVPKRQQQMNILYVDKEIIEGAVDRYEFPRSRISRVRDIGAGAFGQVYLAKAYGIDNQPGYTFVAVKALREKAPPEETDDFLSEIEILKRVGEHPNIVRIFACCVLQEPYLMVMEFVPCGDLKNYLLDLRKKWRRKRKRNDSSAVFSDSSDGAYVTPDSPIRRTISEGRPSVTETEYTSLESDSSPTPTEMYNSKIECTLDHTELQNFALQIARGMAHLEKIPIAHRDLAARNILINEYKTLKISDFGLSRIGPYINNKTKKMPLRWVAIEAIEDHFYDSKGDVWSFAVVLWEIGTLGAFPYENVADGMLHHYLASGKRLPRPEICTDELYGLMLRCWSHDPQSRPSFQELADLLDVKKRRVYVDFNQLNPLYVFPPATLRELHSKMNLDGAEPPT